MSKTPDPPALVGSVTIGDSVSVAANRSGRKHAVPSSGSCPCSDSQNNVVARNPVLSRQPVRRVVSSSSRRRATSIQVRPSSPAREHGSFPRWSCQLINGVNGRRCESTSTVPCCCPVTPSPASSLTRPPSVSVSSRRQSRAHRMSASAFHSDRPGRSSEDGSRPASLEVVALATSSPDSASIAMQVVFVVPRSIPARRVIRCPWVASSSAVMATL